MVPTKKITYYLLFSFMLCSILLCAHHYMYKPAEISSQTVTDSLEKRELLMWDHIVTTTGVTKEDCIQLKNEQAPEFIKKIKKHASLQKELSEETVSFVRALLKEHGIDPNSITLLAFNNPDCAAAASISSLYINERLLESYDDNMKKYVVRHEISHLLHEDPGMQNALECLLRKESESAQDITYAVSRFCEERADAEAFLCGITFVEGGLALLQQQENMYGADATSPTHPSFAERKVLAKSIGSTFGTTLA